MSRIPFTGFWTLVILMSGLAVGVLKPAFAQDDFEDLLAAWVRAERDSNMQPPVVLVGDQVDGGSSEANELAANATGESSTNSAEENEGASTAESSSDDSSSAKPKDTPLKGDGEKSPPPPEASSKKDSSASEASSKKDQTSSPQPSQGTVDIDDAENLKDSQSDEQHEKVLEKLDQGVSAGNSERHKVDHSTSLFDPKSPSLVQKYKVNVNNLNIREYIKFVSRISGKNFIFNDQDLNFPITYITEDELSVNQIMDLLIQVLRTHSMEVLESGNNLLIHKSGDGVLEVAPVVADETTELRPPDPTMVTRIFQLHNTSPDQMASIVKTMVSTNAIVETADATRHLIVSDTTSNVAKIAQMLDTLDSPNQSLEVSIYHARHTGIVQLIPMAEKILAPLVEDNPLVMVPQNSSGSVYIVSTPYLVDRAKSILLALDVPSIVGKQRFDEKGGELPTVLPPGHVDQTEFVIYKLQYHKGDSIQLALRQIGMSLATTGLANAQLVEAINSIEWLAVTNSLIVTGNKTVLPKVLELIVALDVPLRQVFIEVLVLDTTINGTLAFGVDNGFRSQGMTVGSVELADATGFSSPVSPLPGALTALTPTSGTPQASTIAPGPGSFALGVIGKFLTHNGEVFGSLGALVQSIATDSDTDILLNPQIVAEDAVTAEIFVGQNRRFTTGTVTTPGSDNTSENYIYRDVGTRLTVTPYLGGENNNMVTLEVSQTIENTQGNDDSANGLITNNTSTTTRLHVPNGNFVILSGMVQDQNTKNVRRVPCVGGVPLIGSLFRGESNQSDKRNIMIFIRPHIVWTEEDMENLTQRQKDLYYQRSTQNEGAEDVQGFLEFLNLSPSCMPTFN